MSLPAAARLTIDLDALARNYRQLRDLAPGAEAAPVVKADGYGLGAAQIASRLWAEGARSFFVARLAEGEALRTALGAARPARILVLDGLIPGTEARFKAANLVPVLSSMPQIEAATALAGQGTLECALQVDTGMYRQGLPMEQTKALVQAGDRLSHLKIDLIMSHLGSATLPDDPRNRAQLEAFREVRQMFPEAKASLAASAGIFLGPDYRFDLVRPGISLYGGGPEERPDPRLQAVATFTAPLLAIRHVPAGSTIGYGPSMVVDRPSRVGLVGAGYADGLIRAAKGKSQAWVDGGLCRVLIVTMDLIVIDLEDAEVQVGDWVEFMGRNVALDDLASAAGTVAHECLVRLNRAERIYRGEA